MYSDLSFILHTVNENDLFVRAFLAYFAETCTHSIFSKFTDNVFHFVHCVYPVMSEVHKYISLFSYSKIQWYRETAAKCYLKEQKQAPSLDYYQ